MFNIKMNFFFLLFFFFEVYSPELYNSVFKNEPRNFVRNTRKDGSLPSVDVLEANSSLRFSPSIFFFFFFNIIYFFRFDFFIFFFLFVSIPSGFSFHPYFGRRILLIFQSVVEYSPMQVVDGVKELTKEIRDLNFRDKKSRGEINVNEV